MSAWLRRLPAMVTALLAVGFILAARDFKPAASTIPTLVGWTVLGLSLLDLATQSTSGVGTLLRRLFTSASPDQRHVPAMSGGRQAAAVGGLLALVGGFFTIGLLASCAGFVLFAFRFGAGTSWIRAVVAALVMAALLWLAFGLLLGLDLPRGLLFDRGEI